MPSKPSKPRTLYIVAAVALAALVAWGTWPRPVAVDVDDVRREPLEVGFSEEGRTRLIDRYTIAAPLDGTLQRVALLPGDRVQVGQVVASLRPHRAALLDAATRAALESQRRAADAGLDAALADQAAMLAQRDHAKQTAARLAALAARGQAAAQASDDAQAALVVAEANLRRASAATSEARNTRAAVIAPMDWEGRQVPQASDIPLLAPVAGVVMQRMIESEGPVRAGQAILEIGDPSHLEVVVDVLTADATRLSPGVAVRLSAAADGAAVRGTLRRIEPGGFTKVSALGVEEQRVRAIVDFVDVPAGWGDGYRVDARFSVWQSASVPTVPIAALLRDGPAWTVYEVSRGRARLRRVDIGHMGEARAEVESGLEPGSLVVLYPGDEMRDGARVRPSRDPPSRN